VPFALRLDALESLVLEGREAVGEVVVGVLETAVTHVGHDVILSLTG
jgi:hypothetical protein